ncbi:MAG: bacillithiol biosynthesis deacetylase BshB1 [Bernardetiaceae bacterium]
MEPPKKLDILAFAAHPDDTELSCSGTLAAHIAKGYRVGVIDFTRGEMGTRGTADIRDREAAAAAAILGLAVRQNMGFRDAFFEDNEANCLALVRMIRRYQPRILLANAPKDRHPDHGRAAILSERAFFLSGLPKIKTEDNGQPQEAWRPEVMYHYIQSEYLSPDFVVDITPFWEKKTAAIAAFRSQFFDPKSDEPATFLSTPEFMEFIQARAKELGQAIRVRYGEGFLAQRQVGVRDFFDLV